MAPCSVATASNSAACAGVGGPVRVRAGLRRGHDVFSGSPSATGRPPCRTRRWSRAARPGSRSSGRRAGRRSSADSRSAGDRRRRSAWRRRRGGAGAWWSGSRWWWRRRSPVIRVISSASARACAVRSAAMAVSVATMREPRAASGGLAGEQAVGIGAVELRAQIGEIGRRAAAVRTPCVPASSPRASAAGTAEINRLRRLRVGGALGTSTSCHVGLASMVWLRSVWPKHGRGWRIVDNRFPGPVGRENRVRTTQDEELAVASDDPLRSARLPSREQVIELLDGEFARAGYEVEDVAIDAATRPPTHHRRSPTATTASTSTRSRRCPGWPPSCLDAARRPIDDAPTSWRSPRAASTDR